LVADVTKSLCGAAAISTAVLLAAGMEPGSAGAETAPATTAATRDLCATGNAQLRLGLLAEAKKSFGDVLAKDGVHDDCARVGLVALTARHCALGNRYLKAEDLSKAEAEYKAALQTDPSPGGQAGGCGVRGLEAVDDAKPWSDRAKDFTDDFVKYAGFVAIVGGILVLAAGLLLSPTFVRKGLLHIAGVRRLVRPRLATADFNAPENLQPDGKTFSARTRVQLNRPSGLEGPDAVLDGGQLYEGMSKALSELGDVSSHLKALGALMRIAQALWPRRRFALAGSLTAAATSPLMLQGAVPVLEERGAVRATDELPIPPRARPLSPNDLALATAEWARHEVRGACGFPGRRGFGTGAAYAFAAVASEIPDDLGRAARLYRCALAADGRNAAAWIGLGTVNAQRGELITGLRQVIHGVSLLDG
jgi:tetratricopeptide (TPR) repeat protein